MPQANVKDILSSRLEFLWPSSPEERKVFDSKDGGWFYTFKLASGQGFVARISDTDEVFTFRPFPGLLPGLRQFEWRKRKQTSDLGYDTLLWTDSGISNSEEIAYREVLTPTPVNEKGCLLTKIVFQHYRYPQMLERAVCVRNQLVIQREIEQALLNSQKQLQKLMIPGKKTEPVIQRKIQERRQKNG